MMSVMATDRRMGALVLALAWGLLAAAARGQEGDATMCKATQALSMDEAKFLAATGRVVSCLFPFICVAFLPSLAPR